MKKYQNLDPITRYKNLYKTTPAKTDRKILGLGDKTLLRFFCNFTFAALNKNSDMLECHYPELKSLKLPCFSLDLILKAFHKLPSLKTKRRTGSDKTYSNFDKNFIFPNQPTWMKVLRYDCIT